MAHPPYTPLVADEEAKEAWALESLLQNQLAELQTEQVRLTQLRELNDRMHELQQGVVACEQWNDRDRSLYHHAMAGAQVIFHELQPALEQHRELTREVALESLGDSLKRVWEAIVRTVKRIWERITGFFKARDMQALYIRERLKRLLFALEGLEGAVASVKVIQVGSSYHSLGKRGDGPAGPRELLTGLTEYQQLVAHVYGRYIGLLDSTGHAISRAFDSFNFEQPESSVQAINDAAKPFSGESLYAAAGVVKRVNHSEYPGSVVHSSNALIGGRELLVVEKEPKEQASLDEMTSVLTQTRVVLSLSHSAPTGNAEIAPYAVSDLKAALHEVERLVVHLEGHRLSRTVERLGSIQAHMLRTAELVQKKTTSHPGLVGRVLEYTSSYADWCLHPVAEVSGSIQQIATQVMALVNANIRAYRGAPGF